MYFSIAEKSTQNVLIIADRGVMKASAVIAKDKEAWDRILNKLSLEEIKISDNRNNHVDYLQSAAIGVGLRSSSPSRITPPGSRGLSWPGTGIWRTWRPGEITQTWTSLTTDQTSVPKSVD